MSELVYHKNVIRKRNILLSKGRYTRKRERRQYLTEAFLDGELALYKPERLNIPYFKLLASRIGKIFEDSAEQKRIRKEIAERKKKYDSMATEVNPGYNFFERIILWIRKIFNKLFVKWRLKESKKDI